MKKTHLAALAALAIAVWYAVGLPGLIETFRVKNAPVLKIALRTSVLSIAQVFFDVGRGYSEPDSVVKATYMGLAYDEYNFRVPTGRLTAVRFDPLATNGEVFVSSARLVDGYDRLLHAFSLDDFKPLNQIRAVVKLPEGGLRITTVSDAADPSLALALPAPVELGAYGQLTFAHWAKVIGWHTLAGALLAGLFWMNWKLSANRWRGRLGFAADAAASSEEAGPPVELILYLACVAAALAAGGFYLEQTLLRLLL